MRRALVALAVVALTGCASGDDDDGNNGDTDTDTDTDADVDYGDGTTNGPDAPAGTPDTIWEATLDEGDTMDMAWASTGTFACFVGTEVMNFDGANVLVEHDQQADHDIYARVTPEKDLDVSIYVIQVAAGSSSWPPSMSPTACEAMADFEDDHNPGTAEVVKMGGWTEPYRVVIGVAGADKATSGHFKLEVWNTAR